MLLRIGKNGFIVNKGSKEKIQPEFKEVVQNTKQACIKFFSKDVVSFYVRGSVSVGRAIPRLSDIDCVLVLNREVDQADKKWSTGLALKLEKKHSEVDGIDLTVLSFGELLYSPEYKNLRIFLKTQSARLYGKEILGYLAAVRPGKELALHMYGNVTENLEDLLNIFKTGKTRKYLGRKKPLEFWCIWTCRTILRSALALTMAEKPVYTPDLKDCKKIFEKRYPEFKCEMKKVIYWAINPTDKKEVFYNFLVDFIPKYDKLWSNLNNCAIANKNKLK